MTGTVEGSATNPSPPREVEHELLRRALAGERLTRVLDVGCGRGEMSPTVLERAREYIGIDPDRSRIERAQQAFQGSGKNRAFLIANSNHLPFTSGSFSGVILIRVYHRVADPSGALREVLRVLEPGGRVILMVRPKPSPFTLLRDLWTRVSTSGAIHPLSFARAERLEVRPARETGFVETLGVTRRRLGESGFDSVTELGHGFEDLPVFRRLPSRFWVRMASLLPKKLVSPSVLIVATRKGLP